jgi:hypothetical protein
MISLPIIDPVTGMSLSYGGYPFSALPFRCFLETTLAKMGNFSATTTIKFAANFFKRAMLI